MQPSDLKIPSARCKWLKTVFALSILLSFGMRAFAQELFVFTEPASNMAAKTIGLRLGNSFMKELHTGKINYHLIPEVMIGLSKKIMIHGSMFLSNRNSGIVSEGGSIYGKYRFYSIDEVQKHFRMAAYGRYSFNSADIHQEEINLYGHNSGWEGGMVATQLLHKVALSSSLSYLTAQNNNNYKFPTDAKGRVNRDAISYTFSAGRLMYPEEYTDYKQTNINLMVEFLGQYNTGLKKHYLDIAPSIQFIINSRSRIDLAYRYQLASSLLRTAPQGVFIRLEHNFFNAF